MSEDALTPGCTPCPPVRCDNPFDRVVVSYLLPGGTRVMWQLRDDFLDPQPYEFQLQVGTTASNDADDWADVGTPVLDTYVTVDTEQRLHGIIRWLFYRVKLTTSTGTYFSDPTGLEGTLSRRDWRLAREAVRQELVRMRQDAGQQGYLLKRRVSGTRCPHCLDYQTQEITQISCPYCWGTGFLCGYFFPIDCVWADIHPKAVQIVEHPTSGTVAPIMVQARMVNTWMMSTGDVWVNKVTDDRYYIEKVQNIAERRGIPIVAYVLMRQAPFTDPIYKLPINGQVLSVAEMEGM